MTKKIIICISLLLLLSPLPSLAEKIPIKITPTQIISTRNDEIEVGDWINFQVVIDVYKDGKLYINKDSSIYGLVDFVYPNGWAGDNAQITFKNFHTKDVNNKKVIISYPLLIDGGLDANNSSKQIIGYFLTYLFRGGEIYVEPDTKVYNIFIDTGSTK